nr:cutinase family protein [Rhodococcus sp. 06-621-2]
MAARGSGETDSNKLGPTMLAPYKLRADKGAASGTRVNVIAVDYPARPVWDIPLALFGNVGYFDGIPDGFTKTVKLLQQVQTLPECESVRVTRGGYSQGAMVMHRVIQAFDAEQLSRLHVRSALLVADGDRNGEDYGTVPCGSAGTTRVGIGQWLPVVAGTNPARLNYDKTSQPTASATPTMQCAPPTGPFRNGAPAHAQTRGAPPAWP